MQTVALNLFESPAIKNKIATQFKMIKKSEISTEQILDKLEDELRDKYTVNRSNSQIYIKVDKRKNITNVRNEVEDLLNSIEVPYDKNYLFKLLSGQNEIIVRIRRKG
jgi:cell division protein FtsX